MRLPRVRGGAVEGQRDIMPEHRIVDDAQVAHDAFDLGPRFVLRSYLGVPAGKLAGCSAIISQ